MDVTVEIHCEACGSANYSMGGAGEAARICCNDCGADQGSVGEIKEAMAACLAEQSSEARRARLDSLPGTPTEG